MNRILETKDALEFFELRLEEERINGVHYDKEAAFLIAMTENINTYLNESDTAKIKALGEQEFLIQL